MARRTYDESGDYYVKPFDTTVLNSLNDNKVIEEFFKQDSLLMVEKHQQTI